MILKPPVTHRRRPQETTHCRVGPRLGVDWWRLKTGQTTPEKLEPGDERLNLIEME